MKKAQVEIGQYYAVKVSGVLTAVRITGPNLYGGWDGINHASRRSVRIRSAARLRRRITADEVERIAYYPIESP